MPAWSGVLPKVLAGFVVAAVVAAGLIAWGLREHWDTGTSVGVTGLVVAIAGFAIAIYEIRNAASAAKATKKAVVHTLKGVAAVQVVRMIEQLQQAVVDLDDAAGDDGDARRAIRVWQTVGADAKGHLERRFGPQLAALEALDKSLETAHRTMTALRRGEPSTHATTSACLEAMERALGQLGPLQEQLLPTMVELDERA